MTARFGCACINSFDRSPHLSIKPVEPAFVVKSDAVRFQVRSTYLHHWIMSQADCAARRLKHDEGNANNCDPRALQKSANGSVQASVEKLDVNGRSLNRPVPILVVPN